MKTPRIIFCLLLLHLSLAVQGAAQVNTASLTGLITDPAGASLPNASVRVKNKATTVASSSATDDSGYYNFASLPVGAYTLEVELPGFKKAVHENVNLEVGQKARVDFSLEVGAVTETVSISAAPPTLSIRRPRLVGW